MKYNYFLFTADKSRDYSWRKSSKCIENKISMILYNMFDVNKRLSDITTKEIFKDIYIGFPINGGYIIGRVVLDIGRDSVNRPMHSFEGLAIDKVTRRTILDIPNVLMFLKNMEKPIWDSYLNDNLADDVQVPSLINPLSKEDFENITEIQMKNLVSDLHYSDKNFGFVYGPYADIVYQYLKEPYGINKYYDTNSKPSVKEWRNREIVIIPWLQIEKHPKMNLMINFEKYKKKKFYYQWLISEKPEILIGKKYIFDDDVYINNIMEERKMILDFYKMIGEEIEG